MDLPKLQFDPEPLKALTAEIEALLLASADISDEVGKAALEIVKSLLCVLMQPGSVHFESTGGTNDYRVVVKPGKRMLELMTALRACDADGGVRVDVHGGGAEEMTGREG